MDQKKILQALNIGRQWYNHDGMSLIFLYDDGTWETIFRYQWNDPCTKHKCFTVQYLPGLTKDQAVAKLRSDYDKGKTQGIFIEES